jgi:hypothetical protein
MFISKLNAIEEGRMNLHVYFAAWGISDVLITIIIRIAMVCKHMNILLIVQWLHKDIL